jgi:enoyl-CoA hydratase/carnithine racemase
MPGTVTLKVAGGIARVAISNSARRNAMSLDMWNALQAHVQSVGDDPAVRVIELRGDGGIFVSGADISEFGEQRQSLDAARAYDQAVERVELALAACPVPVVANIQGLCYGGGLTIALSCDLRYATLDCRFRMPAARLGVGYPLGGIRRMAHAIGAVRAAEMFYTAAVFDGAEAQRRGIVHRAWPVADVDSEVNGTLAQIAANAPLSVRAAKLCLQSLRDEPGLSGMQATAEEAIARCTASEDAAEGRRAFMEKRDPVFRGD